MLTGDGNLEGNVSLSIRVGLTADIGGRSVELSGEIRTQLLDELIINENLESSVLISTTFPTREPLIEQVQIELDVDSVKIKINIELLGHRTSGNNTGTTNNGLTRTGGNSLTREVNEGPTISVG